MTATTITADNLSTGDTLTDTETGETLEHTRESDTLEFRKYTPDGDAGGYVTVQPDVVTDLLADGRFEPDDVRAHRPNLPEHDIDIDDPSEAYIRFGDIPDGERSYDHANDRAEAGVSVYDATVDYAPDTTDATLMFAPTGSQTQQISTLMFRDTYIVTGEEVGTGADGEPVLRDVEIVAEVTTPKGVGGWVLRSELEGDDE